MEFDRLLSAAADYGFPMLVSSYLLVRMEGRIEKLSANIDTLTRVLQERLVMQFPYAHQ
ncbi:YvrJ family protein [Phascolarctobacterium succinatutens]|uniref:YvrJ family protein n=1 Tax=Phascolarctobacterium succinatutens TaxID=626940 RepID=UPI0026EAB936|nr:YvrJ family protein [Phascolarctobacterium succinatutens]MBS5426896.1 YvrJ family protein [Phascolarctobacterium succinatutens]